MPVVRYYPYATPAEYNGNSLGAASPKYPEGWAPKDGKELAAFVQDWLTWMAGTEQEMAQLYSTVAFRVMLGVATCDELHTYNSQAISLYLAQETVRKKLMAAGFSNIPPAPFPRLFADSLVDREVAGTRTVDAKIRCGTDGYPTKALQINPGRCPGGVSVPSTQLGIAMVAAIPWGKAVTYMAAGFLAAMVGWGANKALSAFPSTARNQMRADMYSTFTKRLVAQSKNINDCLGARLQALAPAQRGDRAVIRRLAEECRKLHPLPAKPPELERGLTLAGIGKGLLWTALGIAGVYGVYYGIQRLREQ